MPEYMRTFHCDVTSTLLSTYSNSTDDSKSVADDSPVDSPLLSLDEPSSEIIAAVPTEELQAAAPKVADAIQTPATPAKLRRLVSPFVLASGIWLAGTAFILFRSGRRIVRFRRALRDGRPASAEIQDRVASLARAIGLRRCQGRGRSWFAHDA